MKTTFILITNFSKIPFIEEKTIKKQYKIHAPKSAHFILENSFIFNFYSIVVEIWPILLVLKKWANRQSNFIFNPNFSIGYH